MYEKYSEERINVVQRYCLLGYSLEETIDRVAFTKANYKSIEPYTVDEIEEYYNDFFEHVYNDKLGKIFKECKKRHDLIKKSKENKKK